MSELNHQPWMWLTRGIPSAGKSHVVGLITKLYKQSVISKDTIREQLYPNWAYSHLTYSDLIVIGEARDAMLDVVLDHQKTVILDETFTDMTDILYVLGKKPSHYKVGLIDLTWMPLSQVLQNNKKRPDPRWDDVINDHYQLLKRFPTSSIIDMFDESIDGKFWLEREKNSV